MSSLLNPGCAESWPSAMGDLGGEGLSDARAAIRARAPLACEDFVREGGEGSGGAGGAGGALSSSNRLLDIEAEIDSGEEQWLAP